MIDFVCDDVLHWAQNYTGAKFHAILADPPAGIGFMGMAFDHDHGGRDAWIANMQAIFAAIMPHLYPGAHCIVWALPRVSHWTATALENAGLEIREVVTHVNAQGFPKSHNVSKQLDKNQGIERAINGSHRPENRVAYGKNAGALRCSICGNSRNGTSCNCELPTPETDAAKAFNGFGSALKPCSEHWIICRKPLAGTIAETCQKYGSGSLNIDAGRIPAEPELAKNWQRNQSQSAKEGRNSMNGGLDTIDLRAYTPTGRWPSNFVISHTPQCEYVGVKRVKGSRPIIGNEPSKPSQIYDGGWNRVEFQSYADADGLEQVQEWICVDSCPVRILGEQSGESKSSRGVRDPNGSMGYHGGASGLPTVISGYADSGNASRFFYQSDFSLDQQEAIDQAAPFFYAAKASRGERDAGLEDMPATSRGGEREGRQFGNNSPAGKMNGSGKPTNGDGKVSPMRNNHPTVKSLKLGIYLSKLLSIPDAYAPRRLLNPFGGSGSESISALLSGAWDEITYIEKEPDYAAIAEKRAAYWAAQQAKEQPMLLEVA